MAQSNTTMNGELGTITKCTPCYEDMDIITSIKAGRLKWAGHVVRMDQQQPAKPEGIRKRGRSKLSWEDGADNDVNLGF
jgi:hypothetical protein